MQRSWAWRHRWWFWGAAIALTAVLVLDIIFQLAGKGPLLG